MAHDFMRPVWWQVLGSWLLMASCRVFNNWSLLGGIQLYKGSEGQRASDFMIRGGQVRTADKSECHFQK